MAKNSIRDYSATNSSNTDIQSIDISEGCSPAGINNAIREVMADLKDVSTGAVALESPAADSLSVTGDLTVDTNTLYVDSTNNNVGIGTTSPNNLLEVRGASSGQQVLHLSNSAGASQGGATNDIRVTCGGNVYWGDLNINAYNMKFSPQGTEAMRIDSSGNLLVGATSAVFAGATYRAGFKASNNIMAVHRTSGNQGTAIAFINENNVQSGYIYNLTNSTSYNTTSDYRLKTDVTYNWDATSRLKQLKPARFAWIADGDDAVPVDGFLAHEVQDIVPEAIVGEKDAMRDEEYEVSAATGDIYTPAIDAVLDEDGNEVTPAVAEVIHSTDVERPEELAEGQQWRETTAAVMGTRSVPDYQGIDQSKLVPLLVKTIQELEARITALEAN